MSPHTPGPWYQHSARIERIIVNGSCVYEVRDTTTDGGFAGNGDGLPNPQDVRLMAAAPELLAALKAVCEAWDSREDDYFPGMTHAQDLAETAIAKAEGRNK